jgi:hypothetical protein
MGRFTDLARRLREENPQVGDASLTSITNDVKINSIDSNRDRVIDKLTSEGPEDTVEGTSPVDSLQSGASGVEYVVAEASEEDTNVRITNLTNLSPGDAGDTNLRSTNLTNLTAPERCIHEMAPKKCAVCNGYVRWLIAGGAARIEEARNSPEASRRLYWRLIEGGA